MPPIGPIHGSCTDVLNMQFASKLDDYRDPDRFSNRYCQLDTVTEGKRSLMIDGTEIRIDVGKLFQTYTSRGQV